MTVRMTGAAFRKTDGDRGPNSATEGGADFGKGETPLLALRRSARQRSRRVGRVGIVCCGCLLVDGTSSGQGR